MMMREQGSIRLRHIVAATDLSEESDCGLRVAADLARVAGARLSVFHCVRRPVFPYWEGVIGEETREEWLESARKEGEEQVARVLGVDANLESMDVVLGKPTTAIAEYSVDVAADLLVLGPHAPRGVFDDLLGSTADRLIRSVSVPCLIANKSRRQMDVPLRRVLFPVDFSDQSNHCVRVALDLLAGDVFVPDGGGKETCVEILFVNAFALPHFRPFSVAPLLEKMIVEARSRLPEGSKVNFIPRVVSEPFPVDGIRFVAEQMEADLIVLGTHGHGALGRAMIGSVASSVARTIPFPVMLVPPSAALR